MASTKYIEYNNMITRKKENGFFELEYDLRAINEFEIEIKEKLVSFESPIARIE